MRKVDGRTLATAIREARSFEDRLALLPTLVQVAHTLGFAHERGVVHRDVKPDNVVLGDHGETILLDWGIARVRGVTFAPSVGGVAPDAHATSAGAVMGTPAYMAPEQAAGRVDEIDERTDVFALGAMLYHVLSGAPPYTGPTSAAVLARAIGAEHTPIDRAAPKVARELHALINTAMAKERTERYPNASAFADALQEFLNSRVRDRSSPIVRTLGTAIGLGIVAAVILFAIMLADTISSIGEQGFAAYAYIVLTTLGVCLGVIDWITKGRNHLAPLVLACAGTTMLTGFAGLFAGIGIVVRAAARVPPDETMPVLLEGMWEVSGNIPFAAAAAGVQLVLWALVRRARLLAVQDGD